MPDGRVRTMRESIPAEDWHTANTEEVSRSLPISSEHADPPSPQALFVSTQKSEEDVLYSDIKPTQVHEGAVAGSPSASRLHHSGSAIEDNEADYEVVYSRVVPASKHHHGLTAQELMVIVAGYRGHEGGLAGLQRKALLSMLKYYEVSAEP